MTDNNIYPNTEAYLVLAPPGAGSHFMLNLLSNFYYDSLITISQVADAHEPLYDLNLNKESVLTALYADVKSSVAPELKFCPIDPDKPIFLASHDGNLSLSYFFRKYPNGKVILITVGVKQLPRLQLNIFIKTLIANFNKDNHTAMHSWAKITKGYLPFKNKLPTTISNDDIRDFIIHACSGNSTFTKFYHDYYIHPKFENNVCRIDYSNMLNNPTYVIDQLSNFIGKKILPVGILNYNHYIDKQKEFINSHAPWINEYEQN